MLLNVGERTAWRASWMWKKFLRFGVAFLLVTGFTVLLWPRFHNDKVVVHSSSHNITLSDKVHCRNVNLEALGRLNVKKLGTYVRREVIAVPSDAEDLPISQQIQTPLLNTKLYSQEEQVSIQQQSQVDCSNPFPITVQVPPRPKTADASHIDFGVATTLERLNVSLDAFAHWAGNTQARIFALVEPDERVSQVEAKAETLGIDLHVTQSKEEYQTRYFSLIAHLAANLREQTEWSVVIDDDTFFLSMPALVEALGKYDTTKSHYVGGISEGVPQVGHFGLMAFGGAGVFLSRPLVLQISKPEIFEACQHMEFTGDRRISLCIYQHTTTRLTIDHRMRQLDLMGDASGFFEAGRELPLTVHHWKSWFHHDMVKLSKISELCGDDCLLRQWYFADGWVLTNGFSAVKYSTDVDPNDKTMELTWDFHNGAVHESYLHELGPLRPKDWDKTSYTLEDAVFEGDRVRQWYIKRDSSGDQVLELIWRMG